VRVLFSFVGGTGHFLPTLPVARALADRGHEILYTCQGPMIRTVERMGFTGIDSGGLTLLDPDARRPLARQRQRKREQSPPGAVAAAYRARGYRRCW